KKNPGKYIHARNVYNAIQINRIQKESISDAGAMYLELLKQQKMDPTFYISAYFEARFHDIVLLDSTAKMNRHSMILCVIILIDNHNRSRLVATAVVSDETKDTYIWIFENIIKATGGLAPRLLYTDADPVMIAAVDSCLPMTKHHFCLFHIHKNLEKHFLGKYHDNWKKIFNDFCYVRNSRSELVFEKRWCELLYKYTDASSYLNSQLYQHREAWALCFTHRAFNASVQSTQRVESYNGIIKTQVNGLSSLLELENSIKRLLERESRFTRINKTIGLLPVNRDESFYNKYFNNIDTSIQKFLTPAILKLQRDEINRSIHYRCYIASLKDELRNNADAESPNGMFSEDMFDANVIKLEQLIA
ncbi:12157_t:CDS:2, partial [Racocetra fulgida]